MKSEAFLLGVVVAAATVIAACTAAQNLGNRGDQSDACALASACCASLPAATSSVCQGQVSVAQAQSDAQTACGVLLQGYEAQGLCKSAPGGDGGTHPVPSPDASPGDGGTASASNEGVTLTVESSQQISSINGLNVTNGEIFVAVALDLDNGSSASTPLPLAFALFTADTATGIVYTANAETGVYAGGCDPTTSLTSGHSVSCSVIFEMPASASTTSLSYELPDGTRVTVPLATKTCSLCSGICVDLQSDPANCGTCGNAIDSTGTCENGALVCPANETACGATCAATQTDPSNCGHCGSTCGIPGLFPGTCLAGACTVCSEGDTACTSSNSMETCTENGQWGPTTACSGDDLCNNKICGPPCNAGYALCGGTCLSVEADNDNCGGCGLVCSTGCAAGECEVAIGAFSPVAIAVDATNVYFTTDTNDDPSTFTVVQVAIVSGGTPLTLASGTASAGAIAVDKENVYWVQGTNCYSDTAPTGAVMKVPIGGGSPTTLASFQSCPVGLAVDATSVYWATTGTQTNEYADGMIMKAPLGGAPTTTLASMQTLPVSLAIDQANVYWATDSYSAVNAGTLMKAPLAGGTATTLASAQSPTAIAIDPNNIYWIDIIGEAGTIFAAPLKGGTPVSLTEVEEPTSLATDGTNLYFSDTYDVGDSEVQPLMKMPVSGGNPTTLIPGLQFYATSIVLDATSVFYGGEGLSASITRLVPK